MNDKLREAIAVFRYGVIAPVLHRNGQGQTAYFRELAQSPLPVPGGAGSRRYTMRFENDFLDLDGDTVISCAQACSFPEGTDLKIALNAAAAVHSWVVQNQAAKIEIAYIDGAVFGDVTVEDASAAAFTTSLVDIPFDSSRVILIRTDQGAMFKLGNPVEAELVVDGVTFDAVPLI